jgi:hypothetical protein
MAFLALIGRAGLVDGVGLALDVGIASGCPDIWLTPVVSVGIRPEFSGFSITP